MTRVLNSQRIAVSVMAVASGASSRVVSRALKEQLVCASIMAVASGTSAMAVSSLVRVVWRW